MRHDEIPGWCNYGDLYDAAVDHFPGGTLVEVGTFVGQSLAYLGQAVKRSGKPFRVVGVDHCTGSGIELGTDHHAPQMARGTFAGNLHANLIACGVADAVDVLIAPSTRAAAHFADGSVDFVFLDAAHDYESVCADIRAWLPKVRPGGWLCGHDYQDPPWPGVVRAVNELLPGFERVSLISWKYEVPA